MLVDARNALFNVGAFVDGKEDRLAANILSRTESGYLKAIKIGKNEKSAYKVELTGVRNNADIILEFLDLDVATKFYDNFVESIQNGIEFMKFDSLEVGSI